MIDLDNGTQFEIDILSLEKIANSLTQKDIELLVVKNDEIICIKYPLKMEIEI